MDLLLIPPLVCVAAGLAVATWMALAPARAPSSLLKRRLSKFATDVPDEPVPVEVQRMPGEESLDRPFFERAIEPVLRRLEGLVTPLSTKGQIANLERKLVAAGGFMNLGAAGFLTFQLACGVVGLLAAFGLTFLVAADGGTFWAIPVIGLVLGAFIPRFKLGAKARERQLQILESLPNCMDLLTISVEAGLSMDAALMRVSEKYRNAFADEINQVLNEMKLGRPRRDAMLSMSERCQVEELTTFVQAVVQSEQMGTGLASTLRIQSEEMRRRRRQRAEELGAKAPLKMLLPMVGCIFPTIFIVLLGPAGLEVYTQFSGK